MQDFYLNQVSPIHNLDARVKIILTLAFIVFLNLTPVGAWPVIILFLTFTVSIALVSRLGIASLLKRSLIAIPFLLAALPLIFNGKPPHYPIFIMPELTLFYNPSGLQRFITIALKSWISVQAAILLTATTRFPDILTALQQLKLPSLWISVIGLMWRYLFVITDEVIRMLHARSSRSAAPAAKTKGGGTIFWRARVTGNMAGSLFLRSIERSERVYSAMLARGYNGQLPTNNTTKLSNRALLVLITGFVGLILLWMLSFWMAG